MRFFGFSCGKDHGKLAIPLPRARLARATCHRRRVEDDIEVAFHRALITEQIDAASDILTMLEGWHARRVDGHEAERRVNDIDLHLMRGELEGLRKSRAS